jgi:diguanylate cyclase (GGDEF)-like protein
MPVAEPCPGGVLVAEDDPIYRRLLQSQLLKWGYQVIAAENGLQAWEALQAGDAPQMAILDWIMPGLDGIQLCRKIRSHQHGAYLYVLLLTAKHNKEDVVAGLEAGADDYLTKPFNIDELRARVRAGSRILELQSALIKSHAALQFEAAHDRLTGLWNRGAIMDLLQREALRSTRSGHPLGVIVADLDHFKQINDSYGHLAGDAVLREVSRRLVEAVRSYDYVGRYGGEEFLIVLEECAAADLIATAERIRWHVAEYPIDIGTAQVSVTISLGLVSAIAGGPQSLVSEELVRAADSALYRAKANGRNRAESASVVCHVSNG